MGEDKNEKVGIVDSCIGFFFLVSILLGLVYSVVRVAALAWRQP